MASVDKPSAKAMEIARELDHLSYSRGISPTYTETIAPQEWEHIEAAATIIEAGVREMREAFGDVLSLIEEGFLVRNTARDSESDWAIKAIPSLERLGKAEAALRAWRKE